MSGFINMYMKCSDTAILTIKDSNYCYIISGISKSEAIKFMHFKF